VGSMGEAGKVPVPSLSCLVPYTTVRSRGFPGRQIIASFEGRRSRTIAVLRADHSDPRVSSTIRGFRSSSASRIRAGPYGAHRVCYQLRIVPTGTPIRSTKAALDRPVFLRMAATSMA
jgi:hypothetical protein